MSSLNVLSFPLLAFLFCFDLFSLPLIAVVFASVVMFLFVKFAFSLAIGFAAQLVLIFGLQFVIRLFDNIVEIHESVGGEEIEDF